jgi:hypothetical protein
MVGRSAVLAKQARRWTTGTFELYGMAVTKRYKTFLATWRPAGGAIRVVLVGKPTGWVAFFCTYTNTNATVVTSSDAWQGASAWKTCFRDLKEVVGAGQQQVRSHPFQ